MSKILSTMARPVKIPLMFNLNPHAPPSPHALAVVCQNRTKILIARLASWSGLPRREREGCAGGAPSAASLGGGQGRHKVWSESEHSRNPWHSMVCAAKIFSALDIFKVFLYKSFTQFYAILKKIRLVRVQGSAPTF